MAKSRVDLLRERALSLLEEANELEATSLPEPEGDENGDCVIWFRKQFQLFGKWYTYAAVRTKEGAWYTTGPQGGGTPRSWEGLVEWIRLGADYEIWKVTNYEFIERSGDRD